MITLQGDLFIIMKAMSYTHTLAHEKRVEIHVKMLFSHRKFDVRVCVDMLLLGVNVYVLANLNTKENTKK